MFYSPLRYPGGKGKIVPLIDLILQRIETKVSTYIEPFAGGAEVAVSLLLDGKVDEIVINDKDVAIYSFWRSILQETDWFLEKLARTSITMDERFKQKAICSAGKKYSPELGFAAFFLNRCNRSGIIAKAGPIGGYNQSGNWKLSARFNKEELTKRIKTIAEKRQHIRVYNQDIFVFIEKYIPRFSENSFVYFDPPYYNKGKILYHNALVHQDHELLAQKIGSCVTCPWIITYDNSPEIVAMYKNFFSKPFQIGYSLAEHRIGTEIMIFKDRSYMPSKKMLGDRGRSFFWWEPPT